MSETTAERDRVLAEVGAAHADHVAAGMAVLGRWAATGERFSANDVRLELREAGVHGPATGFLFRYAVREGVIVPVGWERSTDVGTHAKPVARYIGAQWPPAAQRETVAVPVVRDRRGQFSAPVPDDAPTLF